MFTMQRILLPHKAARPAPCAQASSATLNSAQRMHILPESRMLKEWIDLHGGYIHNALELVANPPCGAPRGIVATDDIPYEHKMEGRLGQWPLITIPEKLTMTSAHAKCFISDRLDRVGQQLDKCPPSMNGYLLAVFLAMERRKRQNSCWYPYIATLPQEPPGARFMSEQRLKPLMRSLGQLGVDWLGPVAAARQEAVLELQELQEMLSEALPDLTIEELRWSFGQVESRAFVQSADGETGLEPLIDLVNHQTGAAYPGWGPFGDDEETGEPKIWAMLHAEHNGLPLDLKRGDELYVSYDVQNPLQAFQTWGFVPPELQPHKQLPVDVDQS